MKTKIIVGFIISALIILNIVLNDRISHTKHKLILLNNQVDYQKQIVYRLETSLKNYFKTTLYSLNNDDSIIINLKFRNLLSSGDKIVCYMQKGVCTSCIFKILQDLSKTEEVIGKGHIIFASNIGSEDHPFVIQEFDFPSFFIGTFNLPFEFSKEPLIFILDSKLDIKLLYAPEFLPQIRAEYFNDYLPAYFKNRNANLSARYLFGSRDSYN